MESERFTLIVQGELLKLACVSQDFLVEVEVISFHESKARNLAMQFSSLYKIAF